MRLLIIGGTGAFSGRITERAAAAGHRVVLFNRGQRPQPPGLNLPVITGQRPALREKKAELAAFDPEGVIDSICSEPAAAEDLAALFPGVRRLVHISTVDVYGQDIGGAPVDETRIPEPVSDYGKRKLACERILLEAFGDRVSIIRPSHILGRGFLTTSLWSRSPYLVDRILKGRPVPAIDGGRNLMTPVYAGDAAEWTLRALERPEAGGQVFNAVGAEIVTQRRYYETVAGRLGRPLRLVSVPSQVFRGRFENPPQFNWHRPYSNRKAVDHLGHAPVFGLEQMLAETIDYMLANGLAEDCGRDPFDDRLTDLLLRQERELDVRLAEKAGG
ncbi:MAG TPA: NAD-dependent epimerase/dehydratase family protein [bacterium]|uniref:NAD dependent epimerase/dehydratase family protein n=1 Tax=candidate division TA06 bacterium ADurb.Bin417 TaxID=1852828 RepID=A0A1V5MH12_UNCT6|nr:MAG: NAD dependent epimerase/dehydratase family protein [candidate division TA06 bacterium ADurb.Bin417]HNQ36067.1 NAD-dependent epimerase/dehydratase family protein [bacterium]HNS47929.1 NAD-dependent epimerase/dehydratase family protein [bacterium]